MTLTTTRPKVPQICPTSTPKAQTLVWFALQTAGFELQAILQQVHPKITFEHYEFKGTPYMPINIHN